MTAKEEQSLRLLLNEIKEANKNFQDNISKRVEILSAKVEKKHLPVDLEGEILRASQQAISKAIAEALGGYSSPMIALAKAVVDDRSEEIRETMRIAFDQVVSSEDFKTAIVHAFQHKVAKLLMSGIEGNIEKAVAAIKQDATIRARMILAVENIIAEQNEGMK